MKTFTIPMTIGITLFIAGFIFYWHQGQTKQHAVSDVAVADTMMQQASLHALKQVILEYQQGSQLQWQQLADQQAQISKTLETLQVDVTRVQKDLAKQDERIADIAQQDLASASQGPAQADSGNEITEKHMRQYIDETVEHFNTSPAKTEQAMQSTQEVLADLPGVALDDMKCTDQFCRAQFQSADGSRPDLSQLWGQGPFVNQGFTVEQEDGSVLVYFTDANTSLEDIRSNITVN